jgi:hypothetical protein
MALKRSRWAMRASPVSTLKPGFNPGLDRFGFGRDFPNRKLVQGKTCFLGKDVEHVQLLAVFPDPTQGLAVSSKGA